MIIASMKSVDILDLFMYVAGDSIFMGKINRTGVALFLNHTSAVTTGHRETLTHIHSQTHAIIMELN